MLMDDLNIMMAMYSVYMHFNEFIDVHSDKRLRLLLPLLA